MITDPEAFLRSLTTLPVDESPAVGLGTEIRLDTADMIGSGLAVDQRVVHLSVLPQVS